MSFKHLINSAREDFLSGMGVPDKTDFKPDAFQQKAIDSAVQGHDTLVVAPTGAGKTYIAVESISASLQLGCRAVYTTPLKALSNSKYSELKEKFEPNYKVGLLTGDRKIDTDASVVIATTEIYRNELYKGETNYSLAVLDEVHYIADAQRGAVWEEAILFTPKDTALLMLSASISNYREIAEWLQSVRGKPCNVILTKFRPVELRLGFLHPDLGVLPLRDRRGGIFKPVLDYYAGSQLAADGMRVQKKKGFRGPKNHRKKRRG